MSVTSKASPDTPSRKIHAVEVRKSPSTPALKAHRFPSMSVDLSDLVGYAAAVLTTIAFVPQALTSWRTRDLSGVSLTMYSLFTAGVALWLVYGILLGSWPIIVANTVTVILAGIVLVLKLFHR